MKLSTIYSGLLSELRFSKARRKVANLLGELPKKKQKHSIRVAKHLHSIGADDASVYAGLTHDYLERGGDAKTLAKHVDKKDLPDEVVPVVHGLSQDEEIDADNEPLEHIRQTLATTDDEEQRNIIIITKIADRIDNLRKRLRKDGKIGRKYMSKSLELAEFLVKSFTGRPKLMRRLLRDFSEIWEENDRVTSESAMAQK